MSAALELVKIALQTYGTGDCAITMQLSDPLVRWDERASRPDGELVWGQEEVLDAMHRYLDSWQEYRFEVEKIAEISPGRIVTLCRERGTDESGTPVDRRYGGLYVVEGGKIVSWATYLTPKEAVRAAKELDGARFREEEGTPQAAQSKRPPRRPAAKKPARAEPAGPSEQPAPADFSEEQRKAAKRRAALAKAAREGGRRAKTG